MPDPSPLRSRRQALGLTQDAVARLAGISQMQVSYLELGKHEPGLRTAYAIAAALKCRVADIWPDAVGLPIRVTTPRHRRYAVSGHERPRPTAKSSTKSRV